MDSFFGDLLRFLCNPMEQSAVWRDYWNTHRDVAFIRKAQMNSGSRKIALIASASGSIYETKLQAMLGVALMMKGWRIIALLPSRFDRWAERYFRLFGIETFCYWDDAQFSAVEEHEYLQDVEVLCSGSLTFQGVKQWTYRDAWIGPQILASVSRGVMQGAPDLKDPSIRARLRVLLTETMRTVHSAECLLGRVKPALLYLVEANYAKMGALVDVALGKGIDVIQTVQPSRDDAMTLRRLTKETRRQHPSSVSQESLASVASLPWGEHQEQELQQEFADRYGGKWFLQNRNQPGVRQKSKDEIIKELKLDARKKIAIVFSPILWDANLFYGDDLFEDYGDWFVQTVQAACNNPHVNWIIKLHPANLWKRAREKVGGEFSEVTLIKTHVGELPPHVYLLYPNTDISTRSLFEIADYGITVRGTPGMELPCFGVRTFTAGTGRYSGLGFTDDSQSKGEYLKKIRRIQEYDRMTPAELLRAKQHAYTAFRLRPWVMKSFKSVFNYRKVGTHPLDHNLLCCVQSFSDVVNNGDLDKWASWAERTGKVDYLDI